MKSGSRLNLLLTVIKLTVFLACVVIGFQYLKDHEPSWDDLDLNTNSLFFILIIVLLTICNWLLEAIKWRYLISTFQEVSLKLALKATLSGVAVSFITPFRLGDFAGRIAHMESNRKLASAYTIYGNFAQLLTTGLFGLTGLSIWWFRSHGFFSAELIPFILIAGWAILLMMSFMLIYPGYMIRIFKVGSLLKLDDSIGNVGDRWLPVLLLSISRYLIFAAQYYMCYLVFGSSSTVADIVPLICIMYLLITFIPSPVLGKLGVRESVSLFLLGGIESSAVILSASLLIWFVNLFLPSIIGSYFLLRTSFLKSKAS